MNNKLEDVLKRRLSEDKEWTYPDFDRMWERIVQDAPAGPLQIRPEGPAAARRRTRSWSRIAAAAGLSAALAAAPVYAAIHYNWGGLLSTRSGIQTALEQNLGQQLGQSLKSDGVTLTLHTAFVDENRTVILYTLDVGKRGGQEVWNVENMQLQDDQGKVSEEGFSNLQWDEENGQYSGYFESGWTPGQDRVKVKLTAEAVKAFRSVEKELPLDSGTAAVQSFPVGDGGIRSIEVQPFAPSQGKLLLSSAVTFEQPEAKDWAYPQISVFKDGAPVKQAGEGHYGLPGDNGEYTMQDYYAEKDIVQGQTTYKLQYSRLEHNIAGPWSFDLDLSKGQMESGTIRKTLNVPLEAGDPQHTIEQMVITPTQIRLNVRLGGKSYRRDIPYKKYTLLVNGRTLEGHYWGNSDKDPAVVFIKFERPAGLDIDGNTPITFVGKYKVTVHDDDKTPLLLTNISSDKQTLVRETGGYPVKWIYYLQGKDLYIETGSDDIHFGRVNQTYIGTGPDRLIGKTIAFGEGTDGNNHSVDVYKNFAGKEASIYMFFYYTNDPDRETSVQLQP